MRQIDERVIVAEHQLVDGQRDERLVVGHREHQRYAARHKETEILRLTGQRLRRNADWNMVVLRVCCAKITVLVLLRLLTSSGMFGVMMRRFLSRLISGTNCSTFLCW